jgi:hypothetical protein
MTLPLRFMVTGILAFAVAVVTLVLRPDILATYHYNQYVIAATHLAVLGWIGSVVMGAAYQLVPVVLETRLYSERLARWQFILHVAGFSGMVWMFWTWNMKQVGHFGSLLAAGVALFVYNIARTLLRASRWNVVAISITCTLAWLSLTVTAGLIIAASKCTYDSAAGLPSGNVLGAFVRGLRWFGTFAARFDQMSAMHAHAHLGVVGVFLTLIVGISYKLVPMFTLSEIQSKGRAWTSLILLNAGLAGAFPAILLRSQWKMAFVVVALAGLVIYGLEMKAVVAARKRRVLDWGMRSFLTSLGLLVPISAIALILSWPGLPLTPFTGQLENLYGFLALLGVISLAILGMLYKILPFLVWYASYSSRIGSGKVPSLAELYSPALQKAGYWTHLAGLALTSIGILLGNTVSLRLGCGLVAASVLVFLLNAARILSHLVNPVVELPRPRPQSFLRSKHEHL